jgi:hypothetical protein
MVQFHDWCDSADTPVGNHHVRVMTGRPADSATAVQVTATAVPAHYAAEERIAGALARLGKVAAAKMITDLLPQTPQIRSGDLGEIYATEWIDGHSGYRAPISGCAGRITATWRCAATLSWPRRSLDELDLSHSPYLPSDPLESEGRTVRRRGRTSREDA